MNSLGVAQAPATMRLQESRTVEISPSGLTRGVGLTTHSYSTRSGAQVGLPVFSRPAAAGNFEPPDAVNPEMTQLFKTEGFWTRVTDLER